MTELKSHLQNLAFQSGISLFGVAEITAAVRKNFHPALFPVAEEFNRAISLGFVLSATVLESLVDRPTLLYLQHYRMANLLLDQTALKLTREIEKNGFRALPIPASQVVDWQNFKGHLSHRQIGYLAGLGWRGRSGLLVNPDHGARVRYVSILTDSPFEPGKPLNRNCGECQSCLAACPAGAITPSGYDREKCRALLTRFAREDRLGQHICGLCQKACPSPSSR